MPERNPQEQHERARDVDDGAEAPAKVARDALVEHVPRIEAEVRTDHQGERNAVEREAGEQLDEPPEHHRLQHCLYWPCVLYPVES